MTSIVYLSILFGFSELMLMIFKRSKAGFSKMLFLTAEGAKSAQRTRS
jgi:hypothetical protein